MLSVPLHVVNPATVKLKVSAAPQTSAVFAKLVANGPMLVNSESTDGGTEGVIKHNV